MVYTYTYTLADSGSGLIGRCDSEQACCSPVTSCIAGSTHNIASGASTTEQPTYLQNFVFTPKQQYNLFFGNRLNLNNKQLIELVKKELNKVKSMTICDKLHEAETKRIANNKSTLFINTNAGYRAFRLLIKELVKNELSSFTVYGVSANINAQICAYISQAIVSTSAPYKGNNIKGIGKLITDTEKRIVKYIMRRQLLKQCKLDAWPLYLLR